MVYLKVMVAFAIGRTVMMTLQSKSKFRIPPCLGRCRAKQSEKILPCPTKKSSKERDHPPVILGVTTKAFWNSKRSVCNSLSDLFSKDALDFVGTAALFLLFTERYFWERQKHKTTEAFLNLS